MSIILALLLSASVQAQPCQQTAPDEWAGEVAVRHVGGYITVLDRGRVKKCKPKGDLNGDGAVDAKDVEFLVEYLFDDGPSPTCSADMDGDGVVNAEDVFYLINYLFADGPKPK